MNKTIEEKYKSLSDIEHVLHRPGMYIGSTSPVTLQDFLLEDGMLRQKEIEYVPGILKLIDEIISNSVDEHRRNVQERSLLSSRKQKGKRILDRIEVTVSDTGLVKVYDNGGIPVVYHKDEEMYLPEMLFGKLRSSSNYDDDEERIVVGTNGVGASLTNIFSKSFTVHTADRKQEYTKTWSSNMSETTKHVRNKCKNGFTSIEFQLDMTKFGVDVIDHSLMQMVEKKCILAASANKYLTISFNEEEFHFGSYRDYVDLYGLDVIGESNSEWEFYIAHVPTSMGDQSYSLINGAQCSKGSHVNHLTRRVASHLQGVLKKKHKIEISDRNIRKHYVSFISANVINPEYDSQTKETLTTPFSLPDKHGELQKRKASKHFWSELSDSTIVQSIVEWSSSKESDAEKAQIKKMSKDLNKRSTRSVKKLIDATCSGKAAREKAELWVFEGDSARKHFRGTRSPKTQGAYALKGKVQNTLGMRTLSVLKNAELSDIILATGLNVGDKEDLSNLRFGKIIIATDMDYDGFSICGQFATFIAMHFPKLIELGMFYRVISPIVKATKGKETKLFYDLDKFQAFSKKNKGWSTDYYKGLGSLERVDYKEMLANPVLERMTNGDKSVQAIHDWMGSDSSVRKRMLEA